MRKLNLKHVLPLLNAEHRFLQVLLTNFVLSKSQKGYRLSVRFDNKNLTVWSDLGKREVRKSIPKFAKKAKAYQDKLDDILIRHKISNFEFNDMEFPFRYASGGTLPIIRRGGRDYYCLFYREIEPIGWNIANGGCDSIHELLNPTDTIARELREELVAFNLKRKEWLLFEATEGEIADRLEFATVRKLICEQYSRLNLDRFKIAEMPLKWLDGPDELHVDFGGSISSKVMGCFLNVNAEDFGIEIDRIAWITMDPDTVFFDGESWGRTVVNSPVGLFDVEKCNLMVASGDTDFRPDIFFYNAARYDNGKQMIDNTVQRYVNRMAKKRPYEIKKNYWAAQFKFDLCPVTRRIIQRYISTLIGKKTEGYDIFISFALEDKHIARRVYEYLTEHTDKRIFFSELTLNTGDWQKQIDAALESAHLLVLVGTSINNILKPNVDFEWRSFRLLATKDSKKTIVPIMIGVDYNDMPLGLRLHQGFFLKSQRQLKSYLPKVLQACDK
jgi:hypothetical protein